MRISNRFIAMAGAAATTAAGCAGAPGATQQQLQTRAVFDLGCAQQQLVVYHVDDRTKAVAGCGRRLVYVESCQRIRGKHVCTWVLDTPTFQQTQWPDWQRPGGPPPHGPAAPAAGGDAARPVATQLFDPGRPPQPVAPAPSAPSSTAAHVDDEPATAVAPARSSSRRPHPTDLFDPAVDAEGTPEGREIPTHLFDPDQL